MVYIFASFIVPVAMAFTYGILSGTVSRMDHCLPCDLFRCQWVEEIRFPSDKPNRPGCTFVNTFKRDMCAVSTSGSAFHQICKGIGCWETSQRRQPGKVHKAVS